MNLIAAPTFDRKTSFMAMGDLLQEAGSYSKFTIRSRHTPFLLDIEAVVLPKLSGKISSLSFDPRERCPELKDRQLADTFPNSNGLEIDIIIGQDYYWKIMGLQSTLATGREARGLVLSETPFGTILQGSHAKGQSANGALTLLTNPLEVPGVKRYKKIEPKLEILMSKFFSLEGLGITSEVETTLNAQQLWATEFLQQSMEFDEGTKRYTVKIPLDPKGPVVVNNYSNALGRLRSLERHLGMNPTKEKLYQEAMSKYLTSNHAETLGKEDDLHKEGAFYIPHSGVLKGEPGKQSLRIVFDCSAKDSNGVSLNDTMIDAPVPEADILRILTGFRKYPYAYTADIKSCFLQIRLHKSQVDLFRFLWRGSPEEPVKAYRFTSIIFGSKCSPWISSSCIFDVLKKHENQNQELVQRAMRSLWVDDFGFSRPTLEEALEDRVALEKILATASFKLSKYASSHEEILEGVPTEDRIFKEKGEVEVTKILGQPWRVDKDELIMDLSLKERLMKLSTAKVTRRIVARAVASVFDPLGMLVPWTVTGKLLLRNIWQDQQKEAQENNLNPSAKKIWDLPVKLEYREQFKTWVNQVSHLHRINMPRCLTGKIKPQQNQLHVFCDASNRAMCCVAFLVNVYPESKTTRFICAKSRTNPIKGITLPRAELVAALMGARLLRALREYLEVPTGVYSEYCWTDSTVALHWIKKDPDTWKPFVANRVREIRSITVPELWNHVPTDLNPADLGTRGIPLGDLPSQEMWQRGPTFLQRGCWPEQPPLLEATSDVRQEENNRFQEVNQVTGLTALKIARQNMSTLFDTIGSFYKVLRIIAWILKIRHKTPDLYISQEDLNRALRRLLLLIQAESYKDEISYLSLHKHVQTGSKLAPLDPYLDEEGGLRIRGRVGEDAGLSFDQRHPLILPPHNKWVRKMIFHIHESNKHAGEDWCLRYLRQHYWIEKARVEVKSVLNQCITCKKVSGRKVDQKMAPLPAERTAFREPVFTYMAIDEMGPLSILNDADQEVKAYLLIIACMTFRAVHIEVLKDLSYESLMLALRRTFALYGTPKVVRLDNFPTHLTVQKGFSLVEGSPSPVEIRERSKAFGIKWSWSAVYEPSTNGVIERMVQSVKNSLKKSLDRELLTHDQLTAICAEVKRVINNRPLIHCYKSSDEHQGPICPNDLIYGHQLMGLPYETRPLKANLEEESLSAGWENRKRILTTFQAHFIDQWVQILQKYTKWNQKRVNLQKGDLVLLSHPIKKRVAWPLAVVEEVLKGRDGLVRSCIVRSCRPTRDGNIQSLPLIKKTTRSVRSLVLLKTEKDLRTSVFDGQQEDQEDSSSSPSDEQAAETTARRRRRGEEEETESTL